jgi:tetratricopeptide (TPR) repeat protein
LETFQLKQAIRRGRRAIHKAELGKDVQHRLAAMRVMAAAYRRLGNYHPANVDIESLLATCEAVDAPLEKVRILLLRGWVQNDQAILRNEPPLAAAVSFRESLAEANRIQNYFGIMEAEFGLGWCALSGDTSEVAADRLERVGGLLPSQPYLGPRAGYLIGCAKVMRLNGDLDAALAKCEEALALCRQYYILNWEVWALVELGIIYWETGQHARAEATWREVLVVSSRISPAFQTLTQLSINSYRTERVISV